MAAALQGSASLPRPAAGVDGADQIAGLRAFLRSCCGSVRAGFDAIDGHDVGHLTSDAFVKGLRRLGFQGDAAGIFRRLDVTQAGLLSRRAFAEAVGGETASDLNDSVGSARSMSSSRSLDIASMAASQQSAWSSACIPRLGTEGQMPRAPRRKLSRGGGHSAGPGEPPLPPSRRATVDEEHMERLTRLAERLERGLIPGAGLDLDTSASTGDVCESLRTQISEEREERGVEAAALRAAVAAAKAEATRLVAEAQAGAREDIAVLRSELLERLDAARVCHDDGAASRDGGDAVGLLEAKVADLRSEFESRLGCLETATGLDDTREVPRGGEAAQAGEDLRRSVESLQAKVDELRDSMQETAREMQESLREDSERDVREAQRSITGLEVRLAELQEKLGADADEAAKPCTMQQLQWSTERVEQRIDELAARLADITRPPTPKAVEGCTEEQVRGLVKEQLKDNASSALEADTCSLAHVETLVATKVDLVREELLLKIAEDRAGDTSRSEEIARAWRADLEERVLRRAGDGAPSEPEQRAAVERLQREVGRLSASATTAQQALSGLRSEVDGIAARLHHDARLDEGLADIRARVGRLELQGKSSKRAEGAASAEQLQGALESLKGEVARLTASEASAKQALAAVRAEVEELPERVQASLFVQEHDDRLAALDSGLARLSADLRTQSDAVDRLQAEQRRFSADLHTKLVSIVSRVDTRWEDSAIFAGIDGSHGSLPASESTLSSWQRQAPPGGPTLLGSAPVRSQSCGDLKGQAQDCGVEDPEAALQALREENLRLREANVEMRELAAAGGGGREDTSSLGRSASQVRAMVQTPVVAVAAPVVQLRRPVVRVLPQAQRVVRQQSMQGSL